MAATLSSAKIASPYAEALLDLAKSQSSIHAITSDVNNLHELLTSTETLVDYFNNPIVSPVAKRKFITTTISPQITEETSRFLLILLDKNRINYLEAITERYLELVYDLAKIKIVEVYSACELSESQEEALNQKLLTMTGAKEIKLLININPSLIGGFLVKTDSKVIDLTIKGQLKELAKHLDTVLDI
jgi:F-type H+-transporting ATPase subunit delta